MDSLQNEEISISMSYNVLFFLFDLGLQTKILIKYMKIFEPEKFFLNGINFDVEFVVFYMWEVCGVSSFVRIIK